MSLGRMVKTMIIGAGVSAYKAGVEIKNKGEAFYEKAKLESLELEQEKILAELDDLPQEVKDRVLKKAKAMREADLAKKLSVGTYVKDNLNAKKVKAEEEAKKEMMSELAKELLKHLKA